MHAVTDTPPDAGEQATRREKIAALGGALGVTIVALVVTAAVGVSVSASITWFGLVVDTTVLFLGLTALGQLSFVAVAVIAIRIWDYGVRVTVPSLGQVLLVVVGIVASIFGATVLGIVRFLLFPTTESVVGEFGAVNPMLFLALAVLSVFLIAPAEELLFRGVIQGRLRQTFGPLTSILGASTLFGLMHVLNFTGSVLESVAAAAVIGIVSLLWGYLYERTRNLLVPILVHGVYNAILLTLSYVAVTVAT
jgi:hypothetical protein